MGIAKERKAIDAALDVYREQLDTIPDELFTVTPPGGGWSYAELYSHILQATLGSTISLERCANGQGNPGTKGPTFLGHGVLFFGRFPPVKIKVPDAVEARMPATKLSKEETKNLLIKCRKRIDDTVPLIKNASPKFRYKHPRLGMLNAKQWLKFIRIHALHHLKQMQRIKNKFRKA
ncbi:hypothetical protein BH09BAC6_BH09BAC6_31400 [soil metagenome]|jgi:hypothetical protein